MKSAFLLFLSFLIFSCSNTNDSIGLLFDQNSYNTNRKLWENSGLSDYTFVQKQFANYNGGQPELFTIVKNSELDTIYHMSIEPTDSIKYLVHFETIDQVFDFINSTVESCNEEINSSDSPMDGAKIEVEYHENYFYPTKIACSGYYPDGYVGGLSTQIIISDFEEN